MKIQLSPKQKLALDLANDPQIVDLDFWCRSSADIPPRLKDPPGRVAAGRALPGTSAGAGIVRGIRISPTEGGIA